MENFNVQESCMFEVHEAEFEDVEYEIATPIYDDWMATNGAFLSEMYGSPVLSSDECASRVYETGMWLKALSEETDLPSQHALASVRRDRGKTQDIYQEHIWEDTPEIVEMGEELKAKMSRLVRSAREARNGMEVEEGEEEEEDEDGEEPVSDRDFRLTKDYKNSLW